MDPLAVITIPLTLLNLAIAYFTLREKWRARRPAPDPAEVLALRDIGAAIRELKLS